MFLRNKQPQFLFISVILVIIFKQLLWIVYVPMWQYPDEQAHFGEVQNYAEGNPVNPASAPNTSKEIDESEKYLGTKRDGFGNNSFTYHPEFNIKYSSNTEGIYEDVINNFPISYRREFVTNEATAYPPLYYKIAAIFYAAVSERGIITRVFVSRLLNIIFFIILAACTFEIGKLLFPRQLLQQITLIVFVCFHPMLSFLGGGINSDNLFIALFTISIYLSLRIINKGLRKQDAIMLPLVIVASYWTKELGKLVPFVFLFPLGYWFLLHKQYQKKIILLILGSVVIFSFLFRQPISKFINGDQFISEVPGWRVLVIKAQQSFGLHLVETAKHTYREVIPWYWGVFRWLSLTYPRVVHRIINWTLVIAVIGILYVVFQRVFQNKGHSGKNMLFLIYVSILYFLAITTFDYLFTISHGFSLGVQGRYFFPTIVPHMSLVLIGLTALISNSSMKLLVLKFLGLVMILLHSYSLYFVVSSYFSTSSFQLFFIQASQYKPILFKTPFLEMYTVVFIASLMLFIVNYVRINGKN